MALTTCRPKAVNRMAAGPVEQPLAQFAFQPPDLRDERSVVDPVACAASLSEE